MKKFDSSVNRWCLSLPVLLFFLLFTVLAYPMQEGVISGIVLDGATHRVIAGAHVKLDDTEIGTSTDASGKFSFTNVPFGTHVLHVSHVGYRTVHYKIELLSPSSTGIIIHLYTVPIETPSVVITGEHADSWFDDLHTANNVLRGRDLERDMGLSVASTLRNETGLAIRSMGPAPSRPVIRGLGQDRITISEDGAKAVDLSATSPDHAVSVEPFTVERIEVIRGPRILTQSSSTAGGVVNIIRNDIPPLAPSGISGLAGISYESVNNSYLGATAVELPLHDFSVRGEYTYRKAGDLRTPGMTLKNSSIETSNRAIGLSYIFDRGYVGVSMREFSSDYGVPGGFVGAHPFGVNISMFRRQMSLKSQIPLSDDRSEWINLQFNRDYYRHQEFEFGGALGAEFSIYNYNGKAEATFTNKFGFDRIISGVEGTYKDFLIGGFVFTAPTKSYSGSAYSFVQSTFGDWNLEAGFRLQSDHLRPTKRNQSARDRFIKDRDFTTLSGALSLLYSVNEHTGIGVSLGRSTRTPSIEELYSEGPHLAAYSYETGNPELGYERGWTAELFGFYKNDGIFLLLTGFRNDFGYFISPRNTGRVNFASLLPVYEAQGDAAIFHGVEAKAEVTLGYGLSVESSLSFTYAYHPGTGMPVAAIPPLKGLFTLQYASDNALVGISTELANAQNRVDTFEQTTAGYGVLNAFFQYRITSQELIHSISINAENILNSEYRNHLSRVKVIMPEAGFNLKGTYRFYF